MHVDLGAGGGLIGRAVYFMQTDFTKYNFPSSQVLTIKLSKFLNLGSNVLTGTPLSTYNLFWLFIIHLIIFVLAIYLILGYIYHPMLTVLLFCFLATTNINITNVIITIFTLISLKKITLYALIL